MDAVTLIPKHLGEDDRRPTSGRTGAHMRQALEIDSCGNVVTRLDMGEEDEPVRRQSVSERARHAAEAVSEKASDMKRKLEDFVTPGVSSSQVTAEASAVCQFRTLCLVK